MNRSSGISLRGYRKIFAYSLRDQLAYLPSFLLRNVFFVMVIFIFYSLWKVIFKDSPVIAGFTMVQTLWYLTFTEAIVLSLTRVWYDIQQEVRDGSLAYLLVRPYSYILFKLSRSLGESVLRLATLMAEGFLLALILAGPLPGYLYALLPGLLLMSLGIIMNTCVFIMIGLLAFWTEDASSFYMIYQKLLFIIGGMFIPIDFFPEWLQGIARHTPFAYSIYWPARSMIDFSGKVFIQTLSGQLIYLILIAAAASWIFRNAVKKVHAQGG
jgi:viologen exporter family transport system permease protein